MDKFNIIIGTHGKFGEELIKSAEMIAGDMSNVQCCSLLAEYSFEEYMKKVDAVLKDADGYKIVLVDLFGGTPSNVFTALSRKYHYSVITGVNLSLLIELNLKLSNMNEVEEEQLVRECIEIIKSSCVNTNELVSAG